VETATRQLAEGESPSRVGDAVTAFFQSKQAAAILKHAVLDTYVDPFTMKTGSTSVDGRVAFVDGYAGEGRYVDGREGSPALLIRKAHALSDKRQLECVFVEADREAYERLCNVVAVEGQGLTIDAFFGHVEDHLDTIISMKTDVPLFVFLDPFGLMIPFTEVVRLFSRPGGPGAPATELLINFSTVALRRIAGHLYSQAANAATLGRMDKVCGGDWWRAIWLAHAPDKSSSVEDRDAAEEAVVTGYADRLGKAGSTGWWTFEVRNRPHYRPAYHLVFLTRHRDGLELFGEALSLGLERWRRAVFEEEAAASLFADDLFKSDEKALAAEWQKEIEGNLRRLLSTHPKFRISKKYAEVYGDALGKARSKHLRAAWKRLYEEGVTKTDSKGDLLRKTIERA
jgi:three-Cys-motif partner protein